MRHALFPAAQAGAFAVLTPLERPESLRVFGRLPDTGVSKRTEAGVGKASREETAGGVRTDAGFDLWGIWRRCLI
jgi:hypothetical protein